jgi:hypothetical protein
MVGIQKKLLSTKHNDTIVARKLLCHNSMEAGMLCAILEVIRERDKVHG